VGTNKRLTKNLKEDLGNEMPIRGFEKFCHTTEDL
jgi:hypothetical protein